LQHMMLLIEDKSIVILLFQSIASSYICILCDLFFTIIIGYPLVEQDADPAKSNHPSDNLYRVQIGLVEAVYRFTH